MKSNKQMNSTDEKVEKSKSQIRYTFQSNKWVPLLSAKMSNKNREASSRLWLLSAKAYASTPPLQQWKVL